MLSMDELVDVVASGLEAFEDSCELLSDDVSDEDEELSVPLVLVLSVLELQLGNWARTQKTHYWWSQTQAANWQDESR